MRFKDRRDAGRQLASALLAYKEENPIVLGVPRGGVPVAAEVARALDAPLDVIIVRKIKAPGQPELAMGAVGPGGVRVLEDRIIDGLGVCEEELERAAQRALEEVHERQRSLRGDRPMPDLRDRTVIVVDNGIATGSTLRAAVQVVQAMQPRKLVIAVPVLPRQAVPRIQRLGELVFLEAPDPFHAVGQWYEDFSQTSEAEVREILAHAMAPGPAAMP